MNEKIKQNSNNTEISIILPCLNEEKSIIFCLDKIKKVIKNENLSVEVLVVDNGSIDRSVEKIKEAQNNFPELILLTEKKRGYGSAYLRGLKEAKGKYIFMADSDGSYSFSDIPKFISKLKDGNDVVVGNRFKGEMNKNSMPWLHKNIGNPFLSFLVKKFFNIKIGDIHCGARALSKDSLKKIVLYTTGMEFASEMIIKASKADLKITEIPVNYAERIGESKLHSFKDGWRHLRFILLYSPFYLFILPGLILFLFGSILMLLFYISNVKILGLELYIHPMFLFSLIILTGYQIMFFGGFSKIYAITHLGDKNSFLEKLFKYITIEKAGFIGLLITLIGSIIYLYIFIKWINTGYGSLNEIKNSIIALTFIILGIQTFFSAFMLSILGIKEK